MYRWGWSEGTDVPESQIPAMDIEKTTMIERFKEHDKIRGATGSLNCHDRAGIGDHALL